MPQAAVSKHELRNKNDSKTVELAPACVKHRIGADRANATAGRTARRVEPCCGCRFASGWGCVTSLKGLLDARKLSAHLQTVASGGDLSSTVAIVLNFLQKATGLRGSTGLITFDRFRRD